MKRLLFIFMCLAALTSNAQTWISYATQANWGFYTVGKTQFKQIQMALELNTRRSF
jgi:hypothetical protein